MYNASNFLNKIREAETSMVIRIARGETLKKIESFTAEKNDVDRTNNKNKLKDDLESESQENVYDTLQDRFEAESQFREKEGKGVRLALSNASDGEISCMTVNKKHKASLPKQRQLEKIEEHSTCTDYGLKKQIQESEGRIIYPTAEDMANKQDNIFFQMFSAYTENYVQEEEEKEVMEIAHST